MAVNRPARPTAARPGTQRTLPALSAGMVNGILIIIFQSAYAALIFSGPLSEHIVQGIGLMLFGAAAMGMIVALSSSFRGTTTAPQDAPSAIMAVVAAALVAALPATSSNEDAFLTVVSALAITSLVTGGFLLLLGTFRLGNLIRFIPHPVVGGFLAGTGWVLVRGAVRIMSGVSPDFHNLRDLFGAALAAKWLPGLLFALLLFFVLRRFRHFLIMPAMIMGAIALFYAVLFFSHSSVTQASAQGWLLPRFLEGAQWRPITLAAFEHADWPAIFSQAGNLATIAIISTISLLLNASGLELIAHSEIDLNRELRSAGLANIASGLGGSSVGYMSLSLTALSYKLGSRSRISAVTSAGLCAIVLFSGAAISSYFPKALLGGLLLYLGISFLVQWVYDAWFKLPRSEYALVLLIMGIIAVFGFLEGVAAGIVIAVILFVINYSRINVIKHALSGDSYQSNVDRSPEEQKFLRRHGRQLYILKLQGYIFFGTASLLLEHIRSRLNQPDEEAPRFIVLDFRLVNGLDSSAMNSFLKMKHLQEDGRLQLVYTHLSQKVLHQFLAGGYAAEVGEQFRVFPDLDYGVEWCENQILMKEKSGAAGGTVSAREFLQSLMEISPGAADNGPQLSGLSEGILGYAEEREMAAGEYLLRQGDPPVGLFFIESGQVTVQLESAAGRTMRLRTMGPGTVIGEMGVYLGIPASASVIADHPSRVLFLSLAGVRKMEKEAPVIAAGFHKFIARVLGERLANTNKTVRALMD